MIQRTNESRVYNHIIYVLFSIMFLLIACTIFSASYVSALFSMTFVILLLSVLYMLMHDGIKVQDLLVIHAIIMLTIVNATIGSSDISFSYYRKVIIFISTIFMLYLSTKIKVSETAINYIYVINICIALLYVLAYFKGVGTQYTIGITFNFSNPNLTAIFILHSLLYVTLAFIHYKNKTSRILFSVLFVLLMYFLICTRARSCFLAMAFYFILLAINYLTNNKVHLRKGVSFLILILPLLFTIVYMKMVDSNFINIFSFAESTGKPLSSRYHIWSMAFKSIYEHPVTGDYYGLSSGTGLFQMHNTHLDVLSSYGIFVFILFIAFLYNIMDSTRKIARSKSQKASLFAFYAIIIMGTFEAALVSGGLGMDILSSGFLILARHEEGNSVRTNNFLFQKIDTNKKICGE